MKITKASWILETKKKILIVKIIQNSKIKNFNNSSNNYNNKDKI